MLTVSRVDKYWSEVFDMSVSEFLKPGVHVVQHAKLSDYKGAWLLRHRQSLIISVPEKLVEKTRKRVLDFSMEQLQSIYMIYLLFGDYVRTVVGPVYQGYAEPNTFSKFVCANVRELSPEDTVHLLELKESCSAVEWIDSGVKIEGKPLFGYFINNKIVAVVYNRTWSACAVSPAIITHPEHRNKGYGKTVLKVAMQYIFDHGHLCLYQTLLENIPAMRLAKSLGYLPYAEHFAVDFKTV